MSENKKIKKIIFITDKVYPYFVGGQEKRVFEFSNILAGKGFDISIASMKWWDGEDEFTKDGISYVKFCDKHGLYKKNGKRRNFINLYFGLRAALFLAKSEAKVVDIDVFPYFPIIFAKIVLLFEKNRPIIIGYWCECMGKEGWKRYEKKFWYFGWVLEKMAVNSCDFYLVDSEFTKKRMIINFGVLEQRIEVIYPSGVDVEKNNKLDDLKFKKYEFVYFGRLIWHKHVEKILTLIKRLNDEGKKCRTLIIGGGPEKENLKKMVENLAIEKHVDFVEFIELHKNLLESIRSSKIMIFPSEREGFGISVIETNACGLPVLVMGYPDNAATNIIQNGVNGYVCEDDEDMYQRASYLISDENSVILHDMSKKSMESSLVYDKGLIAKKVVAYYSEFFRQHL